MLLTVLAGPVLAGPLLAGPARADSAAAAVTADDGALALVVDSSGSMAGPDPSGGSKIDAARSALAGVLAGLPAGTPVSVRAYGGRYADRERGCGDTRTVVPAGPLDAARATAALADLQPLGHTPIAAALRAAAADLPQTGPRTVVLLSDGEETCGGDPCAVARELSGGGIGLRVDTVGYGAGAAARTQLACIAEATGGRFTEAADGAGLRVELARAAGTDSGLRSYEPSGQAVTGSLELLGAPLLTPGQYVDDLAPAQRRHYTLDLADGETPYVSATLVHPPGEVAGSSFDRLSAVVYGPDGERCGTTSGSASQSLGGTATTVVASPGAVGQTWRSPFSSRSGACGRPGRYTVSVERDASGVGQPALPLEVRVLVEPPVRDRAALPAPPASVPTALPSPVVSSSVTPVRGGGSFATAALLRPGTSEDTLRPGETVYFRVPVTWGQRLAFTASIPPGQPEGSLPGTSLRAFVAAPSRQEVPLLDGAKTSDYYGGQYDGNGATVTGSTAGLLFRNRDVDEDVLAPMSLAGDHYLVVQLGTTSTQTDRTTPLRIAVDVVGGPSTGPAYAGSGTGGTPSATPGAGSSDGGAQAGPPAGGEPQTDEQAQADRGATGGTAWRTVGYTGGGVAAVALAGALLLAPLLRSRRRSSR